MGLFFVGVAGLLLVVGLWTSNSAPKTSRSVIERLANSMPGFPVVRPAPPIIPVPRKPEATKTNRYSTLFSIVVELPAETNLLARKTAPFGRLLQCQLVNTLESLTPNTPIIGLVVEDLWFNKNLIIPAGSEVHGQAHVDRVRERIASNSSWKVVCRTGEELTKLTKACPRIAHLQKPT